MFPPDQCERDWVRSNPNRHLVLFSDIRNLADLTFQPIDAMSVTSVPNNSIGL